MAISDEFSYVVGNTASLDLLVDINDAETASIVQELGTVTTTGSQVIVETDTYIGGLPYIMDWAQGGDVNTVDGVDVYEYAPLGGVTVSVDGGPVSTISMIHAVIDVDGNVHMFISPSDILALEIRPGSSLTFDFSNTVALTSDSPGTSFNNLGVPICFASGTRIETDEGSKPIEEIQLGDMVLTLDNGPRPVLWIGSTKRDAIDLGHNPKLRPIRIPVGALGNGLPKRELIVSRQHRVMVRSKVAQRMFGTNEVLIPAIKLVGMSGIEIAEDIQEVTYFHILFDRHEVIFSEGAPTESLFTGPVALQSVGPEARKEIETLFPEISGPRFASESVRLIPKGSLIKDLISRHKKNNQPLYSDTSAG